MQRLNELPEGGQTRMDELDVKILRSLISEMAVSPSSPSVRLSLRGIAARIGADDMTVAYRYRKMQEAGYMSIWSLLINPAFLGLKVTEIVADVDKESRKQEVVERLKSEDFVTGLVNFFGKAIGAYVIHRDDASFASAMERIKGITSAGGITRYSMFMPPSLTKKLTANDLGIIRLLSRDARAPASVVAGELGLSTKTVRKRIDRLRRENTILPLPVLNLASIPGIIPAYLSYSYGGNGAKSSVDSAVISRFDQEYIMGNFSDQDHGSIIIGALSMSEIPKILEWAESQSGISSARVDIATETFMFPEKLLRIMEKRNGDLRPLEAGIHYSQLRSGTAFQKTGTVHPDIREGEHPD